jgi:RNA polymerase sigma factor (sigma-70 family)
MQKDYQSKTTPSDWKVSKPRHAEAELWQAMKAGNKNAYMFIYQKFFSTLYHYGYKICNDKEIVRDCIQDLFIDLWKQRKQLADTDSITYYLFAALKRRILRELHASQKLDHNPSSQLLHIADINAEDRIIIEEVSQAQKQKIGEAMKKLSKRQQEVIRLRFYQNAGHEEIARRLSIKVESAYNLVSKALSVLRKHMATLPFLTLYLQLILI